MNWKNAVAMVISVVGAILANAAGVGGGGMFVPMFTMIGFDTKTATSLSQAMITGGALTSFLYNVRLAHPVASRRRPLIDYDAVLLLQPALLLGISAGVVANVVAPAWMIIAMLSILLLYMTWRTLKKGISTWNLETQQERQMSQMVNMNDAEAAPANTVEDCQSKPSGSTEQPTEDEGHIEPASGDVTVDEMRPPSVPPSQPSETPFLEKSTLTQLHRLKVFIMSESSIIPKWRLLEVLVIWFLFLWIQIFKGGRSSPSIVGVKSCEHWFWVLVALQVPLCGAFTLWIGRRLQKEHKRAVDSGKRFEAGDLKWGKKELLGYPVLALISGGLAGFLGIGGGMVIGPLLLEMGMLPQVVAATGALMVLFSSSMALAQFWILHLVPVEYALIYGSICAVAGFVGLVMVRVVIRKYGRNSIIIFSLAIVIGASAIVIIVTGFITISNQIKKHEYMGFQQLCNTN